MLVTFDGPNKLVLPADTTGALNIKYMYSEWKRWVKEGTNALFYHALETVGGDPITADDNIPTYYYLMNGWRIKWPDGNISVEIQGNLLVYGGLDTPYLPVDGQYSYNVTSVVATQDALKVEDLHSMLDSYVNKDQWKESATADVQPVLDAIDGLGEVATVDSLRKYVVNTNHKVSSLLKRWQKRGW